MSSAGRTVSYAELDRLSDVLARRMAAAAGPAGTVAVRSDDRADHVVGLVAALKSGLTWVSLDPGAPAARVDGVLARTGAVLVPPVRDAAGPPGATDGRPGADAPPRSLAYVVHTSGTTGEPKGVAVGRDALESHLAAVREAFGLTEDDVVLQFSAPYVDVWVEQVLGALTAGAHLVLTGRGVTTPRDLAALIRRAGVTVANLPAGYWQEFTASLTHIRADLASLRLMVAGSDAMPAASAERWERETGVRLLNAYGPTETVITSLLHEVSGQRADAPVPIGRPLGPRGAYVLDERLRPAQVGETGELYVGGDALATGYVGRPGQTAERFLPDPFAESPGGRMYRTGDMVRRLPDDTLEFGGRQDGQVKIRGFRIEPGEVENVLARHPQVATCAVGVRELPSGDRALVAHVTPVDGAEPREEELRAYLRELLPSYMVPASIETVSALPLTAGGKVDRAALGAGGGTGSDDATGPAPRADGPTGAVTGAVEPTGAAPRADPVPPAGEATGPVAAPVEPAAAADGTALEDVLRQIWSDVLGIDDIGPDDNFFLLGGDSLTALRVAGRMMDTPWADATVTAFEAPTIREQAAAMSTQQAAATAEGDDDALVRTGAAQGPLSGVQRGLWLLTQLAPDTTAYNIPWIFELDAPLDPRALRDALRALVARHESLRTTFDVPAGEPCQVVHADMDVPLAVTELTGADEDRPGAVEEWVERDAGTPFDLDEGPLLRMRLIRHGEQRSTLVVVVHHIIWDESSLGVLERDLAELYRAALTGGRPNLPDLPVSCVDHSVWLNRSAARPEQLDHWREVLADAPEISAPPTDRPRDGMPQRVAGSVRFALEPATARRVRALARATSSTPYTVLMAGYAALLHRLTGAEDVVVGMPVTTRGRPELQDLIGYFVNLVPVRVRFGADSAFRALVEQVRDVSFDALAHRDVPLDAIVGATLADRRTDADPLFQTVFELHSGSADPVRIGGARGTRRLHAHSAAKFELSWMIEESGEDIKGWVEYDAGLFDADGMRELCERWLALLGAFTASPHTPVGDESAAPTGTGLLVEEFEHWARSTPDAPALQESGGPAVVSYGQLDAQANRFAWWLRGTGVRAGDVVGLHLPRSARWVAAMLGVLKAGAAYLPLEPHLPSDRLELCVRDTRPAVVLSDDPRVAAGFGAPVLDVADPAVERCPDTGTGPRPSGEDGLYLPYTSGSTGVPKGTLVPHRALPGFFRGADYAAWGPDSVSVLHSALTWDGHLLDLCPALMAGGRVLVCGPDEDDPVSVAQAAADGGATHMFLSSAAFSTLASTDPGLLAGLRYLVVGGDAVPAEHFRRVLEVAPDLRIGFGYGPSETTVFATVEVVTAAGLDGGGPVPIGRPVGDRTVRLLDEEMRPCPPGTEGELYVAGPAVGHGYLGRPALTAGAFVPDPYGGEPGARMYRTGDIVRQRPDGAYEFVGRRDRQVKLRGFRIELGEIENVLAAHPAVGTCAVVVREPAPGDKRLAAYLTVRDGAGGPGTEEPGAEALRAHLAGRLPDYMVPATFTVLPALPMTSNGKVDRGALPDPVLPETGLPDSGPPAAQEHEEGPGGTELEQAVHRAWSQVLGLRDFGLDDNFFQLGGDSLRAVRLALLLSERLGTRVPPKLVFACKTVSALAARLEA